MALIEIKDVFKQYGKKENLVNALGGVNLTIDEGEYVAIIGKSGSGKSTLMHILGGVDKATSGQVIVDGQDITKLSSSKLAKYRRSTTGLIYQFFNLIPILTVEENITLPCDLDGKKMDPEKLDQIISSIELESQRKRLPNELSGGQQQRVSIGRAIANDPKIVLADEPTGNLDSKNAQEVIEILENLNKKEGRTLIIITHDDELAKRADRTITVIDGKIVSDTKNNN